jgi:hypothetical protein
MKLAVPSSLTALVLDGLRRKWLAVVVCLAIGIVAAVACYTRNVPPLVHYQANATLAIPKSTLAGLDFACNSATAATLAGSPQVTAGAKTPPTDPSAAQSAAGVLTLSDRETTAERAQDAVNERATQLATYCNTSAQQQSTTYVNVLQSQTANRSKRLAQLDRVLLPAQTSSATVPQLVKRQGDLQTQQDTLAPKATEAQSQASIANAQTTTAAQLARDEIYKADPLWVFLQTQLQKDSQTYAQLASQYTSAFGRVQNFAARVKTDQAQLAARQQVLDAIPLSQSSTYRTAQTAQQQADATAANTQAALDNVNTQAKNVGAKLAKVTAPNPTVAADARQQTTLLAAYNALAAQLSAAQAQQAQLRATGGPFVVLGPATDATPLGVKIALLFAAAVVLLSLVLGVVIAVILAILDNRLLTRRQITALYGKPVIGTLQK